MFYKKYFLETVHSTERREFAYLQQARKSVLEYTRKFEELYQYTLPVYAGIVQRSHKRHKGGWGS